jgi:hypothetical protein
MEEKIGARKRIEERAECAEKVREAFASIRGIR